ncbi:hypothetical protein SAMN05421830_102324 [Desulfomicrobium norvegicum]|uniref:Glycosyl transferase family 8 n=1 Tax=Desulfomicrobium norvegicum (strain DSM 1741 / NCIMB 8310) TaxID=52561 RepID=A0A8G2C1B2_DESNO|nr:hypothetical protein [Desulfomicrobium norvegicum]SFL47166.1 hypothetical protein SAMN05421830_102324 [Desulfomicrobium norvegicum]
MEKKFGVVITCYPGDVHFAQASYMSVCHFLGPETRVCFIVDGDPGCLGEVLRDENVTTLTRQDVVDPRLQATGFGWGFTKMVGFWHSPFEESLYLDADAIVWGNVIEQFYKHGYDFIVDQQKSYSDAEIAFWFFAPQEIVKHYPDFDFAQFRARYACTGTFFARRGALDLQEWYDIAMLQKCDPDVFLFGGEMGPLNFLWAYGCQRELLRILSVKYQVIPVDHEDSELRQYYSPEALRANRIKPAVLHFCGKKPNIFTRSVKVASMNYFRKRYLLEKAKLSPWRAQLLMAWQDIRFVLVPWLRRGVSKVKKLLGLIPN